LGVAFKPTGNLTINESFSLLGSTLTMTPNYSLTVSSNVIIDTGGTFNLNASTMAVSQNWTLGAAGVFNAGTSTVTFQGAANSSSTLTGSTTFYHLRSVTANKYLLFTAG